MKLLKKTSSAHTMKPVQLRTENVEFKNMSQLTRFVTTSTKKTYYQSIMSVNMVKKFDDVHKRQARCEERSRNEWKKIGSSLKKKLKSGRHRCLDERMWFRQGRPYMVISYRRGSVWGMMLVSNHMHKQLTVFRH